MYDKTQQEQPFLTPCRNIATERSYLSSVENHVHKKVDKYIGKRQYSDRFDEGLV